MKSLLFGLMCILDSLLLTVLAALATVAAFGPLKSWFGAVTMWEEVGVAFLGLTVNLLVGATAVAIAKVLMEAKQNENKTN